MRKNFGYYPRPISLSAGNILISPLPNQEEIQHQIEQSALIHNEWLYPPPQREVDMFTRATRELPYPTQRFELPSTHVIEHKTSKSDELLNYLILCFGFFCGMRTIPEGWGHFYRTPITPCKLVDFRASDRDIEKCLVQAEIFWNAHKQKSIRRTMFGAIHLFLSSQSYIQQYEQFIFQYTVLDTCMKIHVQLYGLLPRGQRAHWRYANYFCRELGVAIPPWARKYPKQEQSFLSYVRNNLFHEAKFGQEPVGFAGVRHRSIVLELRALNARIIVSTLGVSCTYTSSPVTTRSPHRLGLR